jgi:cell division protein FtsW (lipid II flippase)
MAGSNSQTAPVASGRRSNPVTQAIKLTLRVPARLRNRELVLLLIACTINGAAMALVQLGAQETIDFTLLYLGGGLAVLVLGMHVALRFVAAQADPFLLPIATVLNGLGIAEIYRIDIANGITGWEAAGIRQIVWTAIALVVALAVILAIRNHRVLGRYRYVAMFTGILLLLLPLLPGIGQEQFGANLWVRFGFFSFQPGELAKLCLAVFFAAYLVENRDSLSMVGKRFLGMRFPRVRDLGPILIIWAASMGVLVFQRDLGTALLYFGLFLVTLYVSTGRGSWVAIGLLLFAGGAVVASQLFGHVRTRIDGWLDPFGDAMGGGYQMVQGLFGLANGGLVGTGLGQGRPDLVPVAQSDFIVASLGEELGLAGLFAILSLYLLLVSRGFRIGFAAQDDFGRLLAIGLSFIVALQVFIVIGGVTRVIPLTGLTTPFLAAGGSSLVANWIIVALLLRLSDSIQNQPRLVIDA